MGIKLTEHTRFSEFTNEAGEIIDLPCLNSNAEFSKSETDAKICQPCGVIVE